MPFEVRIALFVLLAILIVLGFAVWFLYTPVKRMLFRRHKKAFFEHYCMKVAKNGDFYCLNGLTLVEEGGSKIKIDHIIGGDKFVYIISDSYYEGVIRGRSRDPNWDYLGKDGSKQAILNPIIEMGNLMERLSVFANLPLSYMKGIILTNDECFISEYVPGEDDAKVVNIKRFEKEVFKYEKSDINPLKGKELEQRIKDLRRLSQ